VTKLCCFDQDNSTPFLIVSSVVFTSSPLVALEMDGFTADTCELSWLKQYNYAIFRHILTKPGVEVYILSWNILLKFHVKICTHCWNINTNHRGYFCSVHCVEEETHRKVHDLRRLSIADLKMRQKRKLLQLLKHSKDDNYAWHYISFIMSE